jgi:hypothetical protein
MPMLAAAPRRGHGTLRAFRVVTALSMTAAAAVIPARAAEHTLLPSPQTVHIGYFLASVKPVLSIESGDIVTLESTAAIVPSVVDEAGVVPASAVPQSQRDIYGQVKDRGPGPHVLTGPIEIKGAMPGDVLEVRILEINLALDYGYNRQRSYTGALPEEFAGVWTRIIPIDRQAKTAEVAKAWWCRSTGRSSAPWAWPRIRRWAASAAARPASTPAISTIRISSPALHYTCRSTPPARCSRPATPTPRKVTARWTSPPLRPACAASSSSSCART